MKTGIVTIVLMLILSGGCAEMLTNDQIGALTDETRLFSEKVDEYQAVVVELKNIAVRDGLINEKTAAKLDEVSAKVDEVQPHLDKIVTAVSEAPVTPGDALVTGVSKVKAGVSAGKGLIPSPYGEVALAVLGILELLALKKNRDTKTELVTEKDKRQADKVGREQTLRKIAAMDNEKVTAAVVKDIMYTEIGNARTHNGVS